VIEPVPIVPVFCDGVAGTQRTRASSPMWRSTSTIAGGARRASVAPLINARLVVALANIPGHRTRLRKRRCRPSVSRNREGHDRA